MSDKAKRSRLRESKLEDSLDLQRMQIEADNGGNIEELATLVKRFADVRDSVINLPWVCLQLKQLSGYFMMSPDAGEDCDQAVFRHLSRLTKLKVLDVGAGDKGLPVGGRRGLQLNLRSGLSELAPLKDLEQLLFKEVKQRMEREDVQWILDQWPKLTNITKDLNTKKIKNRELQSMLTAIRNAEISTESDTDDDESDNRDSSSGDEDEDGD
ncbi:hypothetical protein EMPS_02159 [Entomortierella parvispora]|uniref:Uncharacterized protein n=1 Tax=Entomortierella parvispora TaxID=205924 RepID=A0A9P3H467_9FUNG|nr:hypothetical protein EMPS_02159 [Entomortierella parvispora]